MLSLLLLQHALAPGVIDAHARSRLPASRNSEGPPSRPYLKVAAIAPPLRFNSPPPPPDLTSKPAAGAPPQPVETGNDSPAENIPTVTAALPVKATQPAVVPVAPPSTTSPATPPPPPPIAILPDETRPATKAEDFLPFFQFPTNGGDVSVVVPVTAPRAPAPGQMPASSATYQQR